MARTYTTSSGETHEIGSGDNYSPEKAKSESLTKSSSTPKGSYPSSAYDKESVVKSKTPQLKSEVTSSTPTQKSDYTDRVTTSQHGDTIIVGRTTRTAGNALVGEVNTAAKTVTTSNPRAAEGVTLKTNSAVIDYKDSVGNTKTYTANETVYDFTTGKVNSVDTTIGYAGISTKDLLALSQKAAASVGIGKSGYNYGEVAKALGSVDAYETSLTDWEKTVLGATQYYMSDALHTNALLLDVDEGGNISGYSIDALQPRLVSSSVTVGGSLAGSASGSPSSLTAQSPTPSGSGSGSGTQNTATGGTPNPQTNNQGTPTPASTPNAGATPEITLDFSWLSDLFDLFAPGEGGNSGNSGEPQTEYVYDYQTPDGNSSSSIFGNIIDTVTPFIIPGIIALGIIIIAVKLMKPAKTTASAPKAKAKKAA